MTQQVINVGAAPNDGTGDFNRTAFQKVNANFTELYTLTPGSYTPGSVIFAGPTGALSQDNANFFWDDTQNALGIGTTSLTGYSLRLVTNLTGATSGRAISVEATAQSDVTASAFGVRSNVSTAAAAFTLSAIQNFRVEQGTYGAGSTVTNHTGYHCGPLIGAAINYGFRAVDASAVTAGKQNYAFLAENSIATGGGTTWNFFASGTAPNYMAGALGIGNTPFTHVTLRVSKGITGATDAYGVLSDGVIQSDVTNSSAMFRSVVSTATAAFNNANVRHFEANQGALGAGSTITNQIGYIVSSSLIGAVNNFGFFGDIPAGANRWNLYMSGTADNFMQGALGIGQLSAANNSLRVGKNITGGVTAQGISSDGIIQSDVTTTVHMYISQPSTVAAAFTLANLNHYRATQISLGAGSAVGTQQGFVAGQMTQATTNNLFFASTSETVAVGKTATAFSTNMNAPSAGGTTWAFYASGTAASAINGALRIGSLAAPTVALDVTGSIQSTGTILGSRHIAVNNPSVEWGIDFAPSTAIPNYISIANNGTYDLAAGSGFLMLFDNGGGGAGMFLLAYGGVTIMVQNAADFTIVAGTAGKLNIFYNAGTGRYRIQNMKGATTNLFVGMMRMRDSV